MPLPPNDIAWPPASQADAFALMGVHDAWYVGDPALLAGHYGSTPSPTVRPSQYGGGVAGAAARWFWGSPAPVGQSRARVHIPFASDVASTSAALLFGDAVTVAVPDGQGNDAASARLDRIVNTATVQARLLEAAEVQSALGGVWLRAVWDSDVVDHVMFDVVDADRAVGTWSWGRLTGVTFWTDLPGMPGDGNDVVWRHLEHHHPGRILHGVYRGTRTALGKVQPLPDHPATEQYAAVVDDEQGLDTGVRRITAAYVPNIKPNRRFRSRPAMAELGRSDLDGIEGIMDALDETWSSLQRDLRLGKGRITVPDSMLTSLGVGRGAVFDEDREVYSTVKALGEEGGARAQMLHTQFAIRVEEHLRMADALVREGVKAAGYSPLTFGLVDDAAVTATEVDARDKATQQTRAVKVLHWKAALGPFLRTLLELDALVFRTGATLTEDLDVHFAPGARETVHRRAETVELLKRAGAASRRTMVRHLHPDWDEQAVDDEVALILGEDSVPDPLSLTPDQP